MSPGTVGSADAGAIGARWCRGAACCSRFGRPWSVWPARRGWSDGFWGRWSRCWPCWGAAGWGGRWAVRYVVESPRFQVKQIDISALPHVRREELLALAGVGLGDRLLSIDTDAVAARLTTHPWVAAAQVKRHLPSVLHVDLVERRAAAVASLGGLYLVDENGRPFKRARMDEAEGLPVLTGIVRESIRQAARGELRRRSAKPWRLSTTTAPGLAGRRCLRSASTRALVFPSSCWTAGPKSGSAGVNTARNWRDSIRS